MIGFTPTPGLPAIILLPFLSNLKGIERRMEIYRIDDKIVIDDYAHHPTEIESVFSTINNNYKNKSTAVIFQPHLFSRTRDFMEDFAIVLSKFDEVYLLDIYPAREKPIDGRTTSLTGSCQDTARRLLLFAGLCAPKVKTQQHEKKLASYIFANAKQIVLYHRYTSHTQT